MTNREFARVNGSASPILSDADRKISMSYQALNVEGRSNRWTFYIGPDGMIEYIDKKVNPATAGVDLVSNLKRLGVPKNN